MCGGEGNNEAMSEKYKNRAEIGALCTSGGGIERGNYMFDGYSTTNSLPLLIILIGATCDCFSPTKCISKLPHNPFLKKRERNQTCNIWICKIWTYVDGINLVDNFASAFLQKF